MLILREGSGLGSQSGLTSHRDVAKMGGPTRCCFCFCFVLFFSPYPLEPRIELGR
jgi:hypothetical protein